MSRKPKLDPDMSMDDIMRAWPDAIGVVIRHGMLCAGCPIAIFHTLPEACKEHRVDEELFLRELVAVIRA
ncbi:DUF1858 domain-containing protein [bacterium]|nr:DUF1858 domain-containing protein [bacterium]